MTAPSQQQQQPQQGAALAWLAAWLVLNHQSEQKAIASQLVLGLVPLWRLLDARNLSKTQTPWIEAVLPKVESAYRDSQRAAQKFVIDYRHANLPRAAEIPEITGIGSRLTTAESSGVPSMSESLRRGTTWSQAAEPQRAGSFTPELLRRGTAWPQAQILHDTALPTRPTVASLLGTGPGELVKRSNEPVFSATIKARARSTMVAARIALDGGRRVVRRAVDLDGESIGWARVLNISPCYFCAMLASRGAVYKRDSFKASDDKFEGEGVAKVHDACRCGLRIVYSESDHRDSTSQQLWEQWKQHTKGHGGKEAIKAFRRNYTPPLPPDTPRIDLHSLLVQRDRLLSEGFAPDSSQVVWFDEQIARFDALL